MTLHTFTILMGSKGIIDEVMRYVKSSPAELFNLMGTACPALNNWVIPSEKERTKRIEIYDMLAKPKKTVYEF